MGNVHKHPRIEFFQDKSGKQSGEGKGEVLLAFLCNATRLRDYNLDNDDGIE